MAWQGRTDRQICRAGRRSLLYALSPSDLRVRPTRVSAATSEAGCYSAPNADARDARHGRVLEAGSRSGKRSLENALPLDLSWSIGGRPEPTPSKGSCTKVEPVRVFQLSCRCSRPRPTSQSRRPATTTFLLRAERRLQTFEVTIINRETRIPAENIVAGIVSRDQLQSSSP
jgi:hypothetical protein